MDGDRGDATGMFIYGTTSPDLMHVRHSGALPRMSTELDDVTFGGKSRVLARPPLSTSGLCFTQSLGTGICTGKVAGFNRKLR